MRLWMSRARRRVLVARSVSLGKYIPIHLSYGTLVKTGSQLSPSEAHRFTRLGISSHASKFTAYAKTTARRPEPREIARAEYHPATRNMYTTGSGFKIYDVG